jgi:hypothetical protein
MIHCLKGRSLGELEFVSLPTGSQRSSSGWNAAWYSSIGRFLAVFPGKSAFAIDEHTHVEAGGGKQQVVRQYPEPRTDVDCCEQGKRDSSEPETGAISCVSHSLAGCFAELLIIMIPLHSFAGYREVYFLRP